MDQPAPVQGVESRDSGRADEQRAEVMQSLASEMLERFGAVHSVVRGASMVPSIFPGDTLLIRRESARSIRCGDIVLFFREGRFCAHRLIEKSQHGDRLSLVTRGDALGQKDPPIAEDELLGRVTAAVRRGKRLDLGAPPRRSEILLRWLVRRSPSATKWLLRWHFLRTRLALALPAPVPAASSSPDLQPALSLRRGAARFPRPKPRVARKLGALATMRNLGAGTAETSVGLYGSERHDVAEAPESLECA